MEKILDTLKDSLTISRETKDLTKDIRKNSLSKKEQRVINYTTIGLMIIGIIIGGGIYSLISSGGGNGNETLDITIIGPSPGIILNEEGDIDFEILFTNVGKEDLKNFDILKMDLYRVEAGNLTYKRQVISRDGDYYISCRNGFVERYGNLKIGNSCTVKATMHFCKDCFDDKEKKIYLLMYFNSVPPIKNEMVEIPIY